MSGGKCRDGDKVALVNRTTQGRTSEPFQLLTVAPASGSGALLELGKLLRSRIL